MKKRLVILGVVVLIIVSVGFINSAGNRRLDHVKNQLFLDDLKNQSDNGSSSAQLILDMFNDPV